MPSNTGKFTFTMPSAGSGGFSLGSASPPGPGKKNKPAGPTKKTPANKTPPAAPSGSPSPPPPPAAAAAAKPGLFGFAAATAADSDADGASKALVLPVPPSSTSNAAPKKTAFKFGGFAAAAAAATAAAAGAAPTTTTTTAKPVGAGTAKPADGAAAKPSPFAGSAKPGAKPSPFAGFAKPAGGAAKPGTASEPYVWSPPAGNFNPSAKPAAAVTGFTGFTGFKPKAVFSGFGTATNQMTVEQLQASLAAAQVKAKEEEAKAKEAAAAAAAEKAAVLAAEKAFAEKVEEFRREVASRKIQSCIRGPHFAQMHARRTAAAAAVQAAIRSPAFAQMHARRTVAANTIQNSQRRRIGWRAAFSRNMAALSERKAAHAKKAAAAKAAAVESRKESEYVQQVRRLLVEQQRQSAKAPAAAGGFGGFGAKKKLPLAFGSKTQASAQTMQDTVTDKTVADLASLLEDMDATVGQEAVKQHVLGLVEDCLGRDMANEKAGWTPTDIIIEGGMGTGKKHAQRLLNQALAICSAGSCSVSVPSSADKKVDAILGKKKNIIRPPVTIRLPAITGNDLAELTLRAVRAAGYELTFDNETLPPRYPRTVEGVMTFICEQLVSDADRRRLGVHLPAQLVQTAVSNKNHRLGIGAVAVQRTALCPADFGAALASRAEQLRLQEAVDAEIDAMTGFEVAKTMFADIKKKVKYVEQGGDHRVLETCLNMVIVGNPGTGKTTFARLLFRFLRAYGVLSKDAFVEKNALELMGEYCGSTTPRVKAAVADAMGGCLFLDEAYALAGDGKFQNEAIRTLLTEVENNRTGLLVVLAGYKDKMGKLMRADPGLPRRFPKEISLPDYTPEQIAHIALNAAGPQFGLRFADDTLVEKVGKHIGDVHRADIARQNGGLAINLLEQAVNRRLARLMQAGGGTVADDCLTAEDFGIVEVVAEDRATMKAAVDAEIDALVGCANAKAFIKDIKAKVAYVEAGGNPTVLRTCLNIVITGNPGTGKTTFSRLLFRFLYAYGVLTKDAFVEKNALELKGKYVGHTAPNVKDAFGDAMGGCLFLDEAYALAGDGRSSDNFSNEAVRTLMTEVENNRTNLLVVLAGYKDKMEILMKADPGMPRRFPQALHLADYTPAELAEIAASVASSRFEMELAPGVEGQLANHIAQTMDPRVISKHNGGLAVNLVEAAIGKLASRLMSEHMATGGAGKIDPAAQNLLVAADFGIATQPPAGGASTASASGASSVGADAHKPSAQPAAADSSLLAEIAALKAQLAAEAEQRSKEEARRTVVEAQLKLVAETQLKLQEAAAQRSTSPAASPAQSPERLDSDDQLNRCRSAAAAYGRRPAAVVA
eukprot:SAG22_NODE_936_length_6422_cov_3.290843_1_plen_1340_part_00